MPVSEKFKVACVQMCSGLDPAANIADALKLVDDAVRAGARLVVTPEMTNAIDSRKARLKEKVGEQDKDPAVEAFARKAMASGIYLMAGSFALRDGAGGLVNRSILFDPDGAIRAVYDKMHMFDVALANGEQYRESASYVPGDRAVIAATSLGRIGMTVCYDLRFAALYRVLAQAGAGLITVPSAFTRPTGAAHWAVLLRARAIETGAFVIAPAQCGEHESGRRTHGHSMIVAPWGEVLAEAKEAPGIILAEIDPAAVMAARRRITALEHDRSFAIPVQ